jgi:hypothetical protein
MKEYISGSDSVQLTEFSLLVRGKVSEKASEIGNHALVYDKDLFFLLALIAWGTSISSTHLLKSFSEILLIFAGSCY